MSLTRGEQLEKWVKGDSIHINPYQCVPDYSCCRGTLADQVTRNRFLKAFLEGDQQTVTLMEAIFLQGYLLFLAKNSHTQFNPNAD